MAKSKRFRRSIVGILLALASVAVLEGLARVVLFHCDASVESWAIPTPLDRRETLGPVTLAADLPPNLDEIWLTPPDHPQRVVTNNMGFRRRNPTAMSKPPGTFRIYCLGDSFTFGSGVANDETWPSRLESRLQERDSGGGIEALNAGVGGYGHAQEVEVFLERGRWCEPDLLILQVLDNDLGGYAPAQTAMFERRHGIAHGTALGDSLANLRWSYRRHPRRFALLDLAYRVKSWAQPAPQSPEPTTIAAPSFFPLLDSRISDFWLESWDLWRSESRVEEKTNFQRRAEEDFSRLHSAVQKDGIELLVVYFPTLVSLHYRERGEDTPAVFYAELCRKLGIAFLDLSPAFQEVPDRRSLFLWPWDGHYNPMGQDLAALKIAENITPHR